MARTEDLAYQVSLTLGDYADHYNIPAIVEEITATYGRGIKSLDDVPADAYSAILDRHDRTLTEG